MFMPYIVTLILLLISFAYLATSNSVANTTQTRINFAKVKFTYPKEQVIVTGVEHLCQADGAFCKSKEVGGVITLAFTDLAGYIPSSFVNSNGLGGSFGDILIQNNYSTITVQHDIPENTARYVYLHYYQGSEYGSYPYCESGNPDQSNPCDTTKVLHDYSSTLNFRISLENS